MRRARKLTAAAASAALIGAGSLLTAFPAHAATISVTNADCVTSSSPPSNASRITASPGDTLSFTTGLTSCYDLEVLKSLVDSDASITYSGGGTVTRNDTGSLYKFNGSSSFTSIQITLGSTDGSGFISILDFSVSGKGVNWPITISSGGGGGSTPASTSSAVPQTFELSLTPTDGTTCTTSSESGSAGTWVNLPAANDCTPPASKPNATLLGWATLPDFPVAIAKRQVDNGWGAYETFNEAGQLTGVFIPAGGATLISAAGNLYAVWSE